MTRARRITCYKCEQRFFGDRSEGNICPVCLVKMSSKSCPEAKVCFHVWIRVGHANLDRCDRCGKVKFQGYKT